MDKIGKGFSMLYEEIEKFETHIGEDCERVSNQFLIKHSNIRERVNELLDDIFELAKE